MPSFRTGEGEVGNVHMGIQVDGVCVCVRERERERKK